MSRMPSLLCVAIIKSSRRTYASDKKNRDASTEAKTHLKLKWDSPNTRTKSFAASGGRLFSAAELDFNGEAFLQVRRNDALNEYKRGKRDPRDPYGAVEQTRHTAPYNSKPPLALPVDSARTKYEHMLGSVNTEIR